MRCAVETWCALQRVMLCCDRQAVVATQAATTQVERDAEFARVLLENEAMKVKAWGSTHGVGYDPQVYVRARMCARWRGVLHRAACCPPSTLRCAPIALLFGVQSVRVVLQAMLSPSVSDRVTAQRLQEEEDAAQRLREEEEEAAQRLQMAADAEYARELQAHAPSTWFEVSWVRCACVRVGLCVRQPCAVLQCGVLRNWVFVLRCNALYCVALRFTAFHGIECCIATLYFSCFAATKAAHEHEERAVA